MKFISLLVLFSLLVSCVPEEEQKPTDGEFEVALKWAHVEGSKDWDKYLRKAIEEDGAELLDAEPKDIERFAKGYLGMNHEERLNFWAYLVSIMSEKESNFNPDAFYVEAFNDAQGNRVVSRGLLQLSYESSRGYSCPISKGEELHDPEINLLCTILILKRWVIRDGVISGKVGSSWRGGARYWSVLRKDHTLKFFTDHTLERF
jgi:hypothetical protein